MRNNDPSAYDHPAIVARYVGVPAEAIEQVQGVEWSNSWDPTHNGPFFVFLTPSSIAPVGQLVPHPAGAGVVRVPQFPSAILPRFVPRYPVFKGFLRIECMGFQRGWEVVICLEF